MRERRVKNSISVLTSVIVMDNGVISGGGEECEEIK